MGGVKEVRQLDDRRLHWVAEIAGVRREWEASILEQVPDVKVAWAATSGATNAGAVRFEPAGADSTIVLPDPRVRAGGAGRAGRRQAGHRRAAGALGPRAVQGADRGPGLRQRCVAGCRQRGRQRRTPGVEAAALSQGDSGKAGVSPARRWRPARPRQSSPAPPRRPWPRSRRAATDEVVTPTAAPRPTTNRGRRHRRGRRDQPAAWTSGARTEVPATAPPVSSRGSGRQGGREPSTLRSVTQPRAVRSTCMRASPSPRAPTGCARTGAR